MSDAYWNEKQKKGIEDTEDNHLPTKELNDEFLRLGVHWYCHYNGSAANYSLVGYALAEALNADTALAMTPPMGWNSWNAFEKDIDQEKIKAIADAMVTSGMRDAGYTYLVLYFREWPRLFVWDFQAVFRYKTNNGSKDPNQWRGIHRCLNIKGSG